MQAIQRICAVALINLLGSFAAHAGQEALTATPAAVTTAPLVAEPIPAQTVSFVAIGDSGYEGSWYDFVGSWYGVRSQSWAPGKTGLPSTSSLLQSYCNYVECQFGVMLGDNIYPDGVAGTNPEADAARFQAVFEKPFAPLLQHNSDFRIYAILGNHDWRGKRKGAEAQLAFLRNTPPFQMPAFFYKTTPKGTDGFLEVFAVDTQMLLSQQTVYEHHLDDDGSEARDINDIDDVGKNTRPLSEAEEAQLNWLSEALQSSTAKWKIVIGHHPLWSSGSTKFEEARALRKALLPTLCKYADAYFAGHEHTLEIHADSCQTVPSEGEVRPLLHVVSGAFSKSRAINPKFKSYQDQNYPQLQSIYAEGKQLPGTPHQYKQSWGFTHVTLSGNKALLNVVSHTEGTPTTDPPKPSFKCAFIKNRGFDLNSCGRHQD